MPIPNHVLLNPDGLAEVLTRVFQAAGGTEDEARIIGVNLVEANLAGHDSHGVVRTQRYCDWVKEGKVFFDRQITPVVDSPAFALLEANLGFGQSIGIEAVKIGVEKARDQGVSVIGLRNSGHLGRIGEWAERACAEGFVSIHFVNAYHSRLVAPYGGAERCMGTNPVAVGMPVEGGDFVLDFATSTVAEGKVLVAARGGKTVPEGSLIGPDGEYSTDPGVLYGPLAPGELPNPRNGPGALTAMGLHKGSGLALACEMLAGALTGSGTCAPGYDFHNGMLSIYVDPGRMDDGHDWARAAKEYIDYVHGLKPRDPEAPVLIPGDPERQRRADRRANGLPLPGEAWDSILAAGERLGLNRDDLAAMAVKGD
ncbi:MAG: Ldh family oxidoreductase [Pseudomonadota bacterium]